MYVSGHNAKKHFEDIHYLLKKKGVTVSIHQVQAAYWLANMQKVFTQLSTKTKTMHLRVLLDGKVRTQHKDDRTKGNNHSDNARRSLQHEQTMAAAQLAFDEIGRASCRKRV